MQNLNILNTPHWLNSVTVRNVIKCNIHTLWTNDVSLDSLIVVVIAMYTMAGIRSQVSVKTVAATTLIT